ncbi:hypothetical protein [Billgrantia kenyensis]|uniref:hypothetical protein n=1 Tax=Billgrantia kenyensis TaxID=321266 RepID=UPI001EEFF27D|nr:hypothetical protein [Halomonas kenyensis]
MNWRTLFVVELPGVLEQLLMGEAVESHEYLVYGIGLDGGGEPSHDPESVPMKEH